MKELLQEIIDAGQGAELRLNMKAWHCGTSCCLCGDVAVARANDGDDLEFLAQDFSGRLNYECFKVFEDDNIAYSIYEGSHYDRLSHAQDSGQFTEEELKHPHLATDHNDRAIAHDYVRLAMRKVDEVVKE